MTGYIKTVHFTRHRPATGSTGGGADSRKWGITEQTLYRWKKQYKWLETNEVRQFKRLQERMRALSGW